MEWIKAIITCAIVCSQSRTQHLQEQQQECDPGSVVYDYCERRCTCSDDGTTLVNCCRVRQDFTSMTLPDRRRYVQTIWKASRIPKYKYDYGKIINLHKEHFDKGIHENKEFLPWHRWYVLAYENFLQKIDCRVTVPYWDWRYYRDNPFRESFYDVWADAPHGMGGNGLPNNHCVMTGPFSYKTGWMTPDILGEEDCLFRTFNKSLPFPSLEAMRKLMKIPAKNYLIFEEFVREEIHDWIHDTVCGIMCTHQASADPFFFLHHGFLDKIWYDWQENSQEHKNAFLKYSNLNSSKLLTGTQYLPIQLSDSFYLPGNVSVCYKNTHHIPEHQVINTPDTDGDK